MKQPLLSICIPTYNRPQTLSEALESIMPQITDDIEVLVVDDGSNVDTQKVVQKWPTVRFEKNEKNLGFDRNILHTINLAKGTYCWFLSDDDKVVPSAVAHVLAKLQGQKFLMTNYASFNSQGEQKKMIEMAQEKIFDNFESFFFTPEPNSHFETLGLNLIYMSIEIFPREYWLKYAEEAKQFIGHNFIHVFIFFLILQKDKLPLHYIPEPLVLYRNDNQRDWGNDTWLDYYKKFLPFATQNGFSEKKVDGLQKQYFKSRGLLDKVRRRLRSLLG